MTDPDAAEIVVEPAVNVVARPVADTVATPVFNELHVALFVKFCVLLSVYLPVAVNCCCVPATTDGLAGVTAIRKRKVAGVTFTVVERLTVPLVAVTVVLPNATPAAKPCAFTVATPALAVLHVTLPVRF